MALARSWPRESLARFAHIDLKLLEEGFAALLANRPALFGILAVDPALDLEQGVDAAHDLDRDRRERDRIPASGPPPGDHAELGAALGIREADRGFLGVEPRAPEPQPLKPSETRQQQQADRCKSGRMLARRLGGAPAEPRLRGEWAAIASAR